MTLEKLKDRIFSRWGFTGSLKTMKVKKKIGFFFIQELFREKGCTVKFFACFNSLYMYI